MRQKVTLKKMEKENNRIKNENLRLRERMRMLEDENRKFRKLHSKKFNFTTESEFEELDQTKDESEQIKRVSQKTAFPSLVKPFIFVMALLCVIFLFSYESNSGVKMSGFGLLKGESKPKDTLRN